MQFHLWRVQTWIFRFILSIFYHSELFSMRKYVYRFPDKNARCNFFSISHFAILGLCTFIKRCSNLNYNCNKWIYNEFLWYIFVKKLREYKKWILGFFYDASLQSSIFFSKIYSENWIKIHMLDLQHKFKHLCIIITNNF